MPFEKQNSIFRLSLVTLISSISEGQGILILQIVAGEHAIIVVKKVIMQ